MGAEGLALVVGGGIACGLYTMPMRYSKRKWEHIWFLYTIWGMLVFPWAFATASVSHLREVYEHSYGWAIAGAVSFGAFWGVGSTLFGLAVDAVGNSLAFTIILGLTSALGSVIPLLVFHTHKAIEREGILNFVALVVVLAGICLTSYAAKLRELDRQEALDTKGRDEKETSSDGEESRLLVTGSDVPKKVDMKTGLMLCVASGVLSPCLNIALVVGKDIKDQAEDRGTPKSLSSNAIWSIAVGAGSLCNMFWCVYKMYRNNDYAVFGENATYKDICRELAIGALMGLLWFGGTAGYGSGASIMGDLGTVLGWPIFIDGMILTANITGVLSGEWSGTSKKTKQVMSASILVLSCAVIIIGVA